MGDDSKVRFFLSIEFRNVLGEKVSFSYFLFYFSYIFTLIWVKLGREKLFLGHHQGLSWIDSQHGRPRLKTNPNIQMAKLYFIEMFFN